MCSRKLVERKFSHLPLELCLCCRVCSFSRIKLRIHRDVDGGRPPLCPSTSSQSDLALLPSNKNKVVLALSQPPCFSLMRPFALARLRLYDACLTSDRYPLSGRISLISLAHTVTGCYCAQVKPPARQNKKKSTRLTRQGAIANNDFNGCVYTMAEPNFFLRSEVRLWRSGPCPSLRASCVSNMALLVKLCMTASRAR